MKNVELVEMILNFGMSLKKLPILSLVCNVDRYVRCCSFIYLTNRASLLVWDPINRRSRRRGWSHRLGDRGSARALLSKINVAPDPSQNRFLFNRVQ